MSTSYTKGQFTAIRETVNAFRSAGIVAVPVTEDGLKTIDHLSPTPTTDPAAPRAKWSQHRKEWIRDDVIAEAFSGERTGIGIVTGVAFRDDELKLGMIEIDEPGIVDLILDSAESAGVDVIATLFRRGLVIQSGGGGLHAYYLCSEVPGNTKIARRPAPTKQNSRAEDVLVETRGTGGFAVTAPSFGNVHPTGNAYQLVHGDPADPPILTPEEQEEAFNFLRIFDERPAREVKPKVKDVTLDGDRPGDRYNDAATQETFRELLPGWSWLFESGGVWYLRRPGKDRGVSATWNWDGRQRLRVFTSSTDLEPAMYSAFALYTHVQHGGDWSASAKDLYKQGFGKRAYTEFEFTEEDEPLENPDAIRAIQLSNTLRMAGHRFWAQDGFVPVQLSNAEIRISHYITEETAPGEFRHLYRMVGILHDGTALPPVDIPTDDLGDIQRWTGRSGPLWARVTLDPGFSVRDQVRACIQLYSQHVGFEAIQRYSETGWCEVNGEWVFRTHRAAIGATGHRPDVDVQLGADFARYSLPALPSPDTLPELGRRYLRLLDLAPAHIIAPLMVAPARAVLGEFMPVDSVTYLYGLTGVFKTELSVLMMAHFGATFTSRSIPLNFEGTSNSTQAATWRLKDVITAVDDMAPDGNRYQVDTTYGKLSALARSIGNRAGRTRSNADMTAKQTFYPRGLVIASGEDLPRGHSASARMQVIEITAGAVRADVLSECQQMAAEGVFAQLTAALIKYVAGHWDELERGVDALYAKSLAEMRRYGFKHRRTGDAIAPQIVAAKVWLEFLRTIGTISLAERDQLIERICKGLLTTGEAQDAVQEEANPAEVFISSIQSSVLRGDAHLKDRETNDVPPNADRYGWRIEVRTVGDHIEPVHFSRGSMIGWIDRDLDALYLDPASSYAVAQQLGHHTGRPIPTTVNTLGKRLLDAKRLVSTESGRVKSKIYVNKAAVRVWHLRLSDIFPEAELEAEDREPTPFARKGVA